VGCLIFVGSFRQKSPMINGSFAERDLQLKESYAFSPPGIRKLRRLRDINLYVCARIHTCMYIWIEKYESVCVCVCVCTYIHVHID